MSKLESKSDLFNSSRFSTDLFDRGHPQPPEARRKAYAEFDQKRSLVERRASERVERDVVA